jgi:hypothetical protein
MLDPRIYRMGLVAVVFAVIVFAFSLQQQRRSLASTLAPDAFNGQNAFAETTDITGHFRRRPAGSANDYAIAGEIAQSFRKDGFAVSAPSFSAPTPNGSRRLRNVIAVRSGMTAGTIVVVAHRDATGSPAAAAESGSGVLLDLGAVLEGETLNHTVVLASTSGSTGAAGATQLIRQLPGPIDAVLVLGDMSGTSMRRPLVVPWSTGEQLAPPVLRNTVAAVLSSQTGLSSGSASLAGDFVHLAFPFTVSEQGPFDAHGIPAVLLSSSGELPPAVSETPSPGEINQFGRTALATISALDSGGPIPAPSAYLQIAGNTIPAWAVRVLVLGLILPVLIATVDGFARARRRKHAVGGWTGWVLAHAVPFVLAAAIVLFAKVTGLIRGIAPPAPVASGAVPLHAGGIALLVILVAVIVLPLAWIDRSRRDRSGRDRSRTEASGDAGAAAALLIVMCVAALALWIDNPFAAALTVPALHAWMWAVAPEVRMRPAARLGLLLLGLAPPALVVRYYMVTLSFDPISLAWSGVLMVAGGQVAPVQALEWSLALGSAVSVFAIAAWRVRRIPVHEEIAVTVRGPVTYAGPGSLGGTDSALEHRSPALRR